MSMLRINSNKEFDVTGGGGLTVPDATKNEIVEDEHSMVELGEIAILGASRPSLRYRSASNLNASRRSIYRTREDIAASRLLLREESIVAAKGGSALLGDELKKDEALYELEAEITRWDLVKENLVQFKGYALGVFSAFLLTLSHVVMRQAKWLSGSDHAFIRYSTSLVFLFVYLKYHQIDMFPRNKIPTLLLRGFMGILKIGIAYRKRPSSDPWVTTRIFNVVTLLMESTSKALLLKIY
jgi:hypothetical protein